LIEIIVTVHVYVAKSDSPFQTREVPLTLQTSAPLTPDKASAKSFGRWASPSPYLGADYSNNYYVQNNPFLPANPVGFFLDSQGKEDEPFLVLQGFAPMSMKVGDKGDGRILRTTQTDVKWTDVSWRCVK
jgi:hypothetical protein